LNFGFFQVARLHFDVPVIKCFSQNYFHEDQCKFAAGTYIISKPRIFRKCTAAFYTHLISTRSPVVCINVKITSENAHEHICSCRRCRRNL